MEIINKNHDDITFNQRVELAEYLRVEKKEFYFSAACNINLGIIPDLYMHFINDDDRWLFYLNNEDDGFKTLRRLGKNSTLVINASLCSLFLRRTKCGTGTKFPIVKTESKIKNAPIYEIKISKAF